MNVKQCYFIVVTERNPETANFSVKVIYPPVPEDREYVARYYTFGSVEALRRDLSEHLNAHQLLAVDSSRAIYEIDVGRFLTDESQNGVWTDVWAKPYVRKIGILRAVKNDGVIRERTIRFEASDGITYAVSP